MSKDISANKVAEKILFDSSDEHESWDDSDCDPSFAPEEENEQTEHSSFDNNEQRNETYEKETDLEVQKENEFESDERLPHAPLHAECSYENETSVQNRAKRGRKQTRQLWKQKNKTRRNSELS